MYFHSGSQSLCHALLSGVEEFRLLAIHSEVEKVEDEKEEIGEEEESSRG